MTSATHLLLGSQLLLDVHGQHLRSKCETFRLLNDLLVCRHRLRAHDDETLKHDMIGQGRDDVALCERQVRPD